jgi:eukaryotic-like serine/threonine-protein kinase
MASLPPESFQEAPVSIGGYRILRPLGEGAMSVVYLGYDLHNLRHVAVKVLADHLAANKQFVNRFYREAQLSKQTHHTNIVRGLDFGFDHSAQKHYLVLEYIDGLNAADWLKIRGPLRIDHVIRIGIQIADALQHLHLCRLIHRDVKPENLLLSADGSAKLADLGLAKHFECNADLTTTDQGVGTPHYMPYEQAVNGELVDHRSDLFALGATMYHLLTGRLPFRGDTHEEIVHEKQMDAYCPAREHFPEVPAILDMVLAQALTRDPRARYQTATEFIAALSSIALPEELAEKTSPHHTVDAPQTLQTQPALAKLSPAKTPFPRARIIGFGAAILVLAIFGGYRLQATDWTGKSKSLLQNIIKPLRI